MKGSAVDLAHLAGFAQHRYPDPELRALPEQSLLLAPMGPIEYRLELF